MDPISLISLLTLGSAFLVSGVSSRKDRTDSPTQPPSRDGYGGLPIQPARIDERIYRLDGREDWRAEFYETPEEKWSPGILFDFYEGPRGQTLTEVQPEGGEGGKPLSSLYYPSSLFVGEMNSEIGRKLESMFNTRKGELGDSRRSQRAGLARAWGVPLFDSAGALVGLQGEWYNAKGGWSRDVLLLGRYDPMSSLPQPFQIKQTLYDSPARHLYPIDRVLVVSTVTPK